MTRRSSALSPIIHLVYGTPWQSVIRKKLIHLFRHTSLLVFVQNILLECPLRPITYFENYMGDLKRQNILLVIS